MTDVRARTAPAEELEELLRLIKGADTVELKLSVPDGDQQRSAAAASQMDVLDAQKLKFTPEDLDRRLVAELWFYPDGSRILELSTKCAPTEPFEVAAVLRAFLARHGIDTLAKQQTKTRAALNYFAKL